MQLELNFSGYALGLEDALKILEGRKSRKLAALDLKKKLMTEKLKEEAHAKRKP